MSRNILLIMGSPRLDGNTAELSRMLLENLVDKNIEIKDINIADYIFKGCNGCHRCVNDGVCKVTDDMQHIYPLIKNFDCVVMISPVYNYNITSELKAFLDRMFCFYDFTSKTGMKSRLGNRKKIFLLANCAGKDEVSVGVTMNAMKLPLEELGYQVINTEIFYGITKKALQDNRDIYRTVSLLADEIVKTVNM